jgi:type VI secretion system secreted protein VgrG
MTLPANGTALPEVSFRFTSVGDPSTHWRVIRMTQHEAISETYECVIDLATETLTVAPSALLRQRATLVMEREVLDRRIHGVVRRVEDLGTVAGNRLARVFLVPRLWLLSQRVDSRIFQRVTALEILSQVLSAAGLYAGEVDDRVDTERPVREFCVQYQESDLDFVMRLMEEEGVAFFFDHQGEAEVLVLDDEPSSMTAVLGLGGDVFAVAGTEASTASSETIRRFDWHHDALSSGVILRDYDFTNPSGVMDLTRPVPEPPMTAGVFEYPGRYTWSNYDDDSRHAWQRHDGQRRGDRRQRELETWTESGEGLGNGIGFTPGYTFGLVDHGREDLNRRYVVTRVEHRAIAREELTTDHRDPSLGDDRYHNRFECVADTVPFRPRRVTPRPVIHGVQTAVVVGDQPEIDTEFHGRVKVQFHWDRSGRTGREASCWIRVAQTWAGAGWGTMFIPRLGMEVVVAFEEGDPDRPLIVGCVYNGANNAPYMLPDEKTKSTIKSNSSPGGGGSNELRFEDAAGSEEVYLHAQKDLNEVVEHDHTTRVKRHHTNTVDGNDTESVGGDQALTVSGNRTKTIKKDEKTTVRKSRVEVVDIDETITVHGKRTEIVDGVESITLNDVRETTIAKGDALTVSTGDHYVGVAAGNDLHDVVGDKSDHVTGQYTINAEGQFQVTQGTVTLNIQDLVLLNASANKVTFTNSSGTIEFDGGKVVINAQNEIVLACGASSLSLKKNGEIALSGSKEVGVGSGSSAVKVEPAGITSSGPKITSSAIGVHEISGALIKIN